MTIFYVLTNEGMPGLVKIGKTSNDLEKRMNELYTTGVPLPYVCKYAVEVEEDDRKEYEKMIHKGLSDMRINPNREFFEISFENVVNLMKVIPGRDVTPKDESKSFEDKKDELDAVKKLSRRRRSNFSFEKAGIKEGAKLTFSSTFLDDDSITASVIGDKKIMFRKRKVSLSAAAIEILHENGREWVTVSGPNFWKYEGEILSERRRRIEEEDYEDNAE